MTGRTNITDEEASTTFADLRFLLSHSSPVIRDNVSRFLDTGLPEGKHFFVRPFVIAGKIPVAGIFGVRPSLTIEHSAPLDNGTTLS
jgi:hypothetical protein